MKRFSIIVILLLALTGCSSSAPTKEAAPAPSEAMITEKDWSEYFQGFYGAAVIYKPMENSYQIYNQKLADTRRSPCSTFKIISSLIALETGVIDPSNSLRTWSGEQYPMEEWNQDLTFDKAFRVSCVWYFREVVNEIKKDTMQAELDKLLYGNCDISQWEGTADSNNSKGALPGFWLESSLKISPKEQTEVMSRIFGNQSSYKEETRRQLKQVMLVTEEQETGLSIYGKTGTGKVNGTVVDSWFTGFTEVDNEKLYFCVYLGESEGKNVSSAKAKEIAVKILKSE